MSISLLDRDGPINVDIRSIQGPARSYHPFSFLLLVLPGHVLEVFNLTLGQGATRIADEIPFPLLVGEWSHGDIRAEVILNMLHSGQQQLIMSQADNPLITNGRSLEFARDHNVSAIPH